MCLTIVVSDSRHETCAFVVPMVQLLLSADAQSAENVISHAPVLAGARRKLNRDRQKAYYAASLPLVPF